MDLSILQKATEGEPSYRLKQIYQHLFSDLIDDWEQASTLPKSLRGKLSQEVPIAINHNLFFSSDKKTKKACIQMNDDVIVESVLMAYKDGHTLCVSTQAGCPLKCAFCATGSNGFNRNLTWSEIVIQVLLFARLLKPCSQKIDHIVFMGMGEPFLNYDNVIKAIRFINQKDTFGLGMRRMSVSTSGIVSGIDKFADEGLEVNLAISLHAPNDKIRDQIMPVNHNYPIETVIGSAKAYLAKTNRKLMFEYLLLKDINDSPQCAEELSTLLKELHPIMVNLIPYNQTGQFEQSSKESMMAFQKILLKNKIECTIRHSFGDDILAACGQLAGTSVKH